MCRNLFLCMLMLLAIPAWSAVVGPIHGIVHDANHRPMDAVKITLRSESGTTLKSAESSSSGAFGFDSVPAGAYQLAFQKQGFSELIQPVTVTSSGVALLHVQLTVAPMQESIEVHGAASDINPETAAPTTLISHDDIERTPGASLTNSLAAITDYVPGAYITHDQLHVRGGHQVTWAVDGVPVPNTNIASNVGPQFDPKDAAVIEVQRGGYSAEYGDRTYGVFNIVPRTGFERDHEIEYFATGGSFFQTNQQITIGSHTERWAYYGSLNANRSDYGLETPGPAILHDSINGVGGFGTLLFNPNPQNQMRLTASVRSDNYEIPNDLDAQAADVNDRERERDAFLNFSWIRTISPGLLLTVSPFYHFNRANYLGSPQDFPVSADDQRASHYAGAQVSIAGTTREHNARVGIYGFWQHDATYFALTATDGTAAALAQQQHLGGNLEAAFLEDQWRATSWLTLTGGLRLTHFAGSISENAASPRIGGALSIPKLNWVFRASYGRYYQAPPLDTVSGPLLAYALDQGVAFLPLRGERDEEREFGLAIPWRGWTFDADHFSTRAHNYFDHDVIGNSNIYFPLTIQGARIRGWEATVRSPRILKRGQVHLAYSNQHAEGEGAVTGGLTHFDPPGGRFLLDHDQHHSLNMGFNANLPHSVWVAGNGYYGSGFTDSGGPAHLPHHTTVDLILGKSFGESLSVALNALNIANRRYLLDNSATFGGMHYAAPRQLFAELRYKIHYGKIRPN